MMNRELMRRQMFAKGGAAFPDLSGDGRVTQKDILMGRGVIPMQDGGMAPMPAPMPAAPAPMPAAPGPMPSEALPVMPPVDPNNIDMGQVSQAAMQSGIDPVMLETMLTEYASGLDDLENAEDYETVMNGIRGDKQPIQQRYQELATVVGPEDAQQTPESVLTLVQPVMMLASVDQGIGSLAAEEMSAPVEGPMAEGIMSTVDMAGPEPMAAPAPMAEVPAPVNFNQGGAVQYFAPENPNRVATPVAPRTVSEVYERETLPTYQKILGAMDQQKAFQDQKRMTEAQMLFDIAQGALMFATPGERRMSPAERLAQAFTPVLGNIGTRAGELQKFKQSQAAQDQALKLQALGSAEKRVSAEIAAKAQKARDDAKASNKPVSDTFLVTLTGEDGKPRVIFDGPMSQGDYANLVEKHGAENLTVTKKSPKPPATPKAPEYITFVDPLNQDDFHTFNKNDMSKRNQNEMEKVRNAKNPDGTAKYRVTGQFTPSRDGSTSKPNIQVVANTKTREMQSFDLNNPEQLKAYNALDKKVYVPIKLPKMADLSANRISFGEGEEAQFMALTSETKILEQYADGTLDPYIANLINSFITEKTVQKPTIDPRSGRQILVPGFTINTALRKAIEARSKVPGMTSDKLPLLYGKDVLDVKTAELDKDPNTTGRIKFLPDGSVDFSTFANDPTIIISGKYDLTKSQTWRSGVNRFFNFLAGQLKIGSGYAGNEGRITAQADTELNNLAKRISQVGRAGVDGKVFAYDLKLLKEEVERFKPGSAKTDVEARDQLVAVRNSLASMYKQAWLTASDPPADPSNTTIVVAKNTVRQLESLLAETTAAIAVYDKYLSRDPIAEAVKDRATTSTVGNRSVTSTLPRVGEGNK